MTMIIPPQECCPFSSSPCKTAHFHVPWHMANVPWPMAKRWWHGWSTKVQPWLFASRQQPLGGSIAVQNKQRRQLAQLQKFPSAQLISWSSAKHWQYNTSVQTLAQCNVQPNSNISRCVAGLLQLVFQQPLNTNTSTTRVITGLCSHTTTPQHAPPLGEMHPTVDRVDPSAGLLNFTNQVLNLRQLNWTL